ncbi:uncharacterized protein N0V89_006258 [Didymosphaeria variabile]|uniref:F-box domain-containing protein n=1 Tax=Didymosphaeria variabile TaxID=1932322 RepID=A0A9W8XMW2_9PLEO|nr:uncharacterized protein N0V89_006258 [Didymosphaeria variabile]KAJ4354521.1 hypothetical protein N0V89_006258 [Didymosphaeria variabile]
MAPTEPSHSTAFNTLPIELNKEIAHLLHDHKDIASFKAICRATRNAIDGDNFSFWRAKFCEDFARPMNKTNMQLCRQYKERWRLLRRFVTMKTFPQYQFVRGHNHNEKAIVRILAGLINDSFAGSAQSGNGNRPHCLNMVRLREFVLNSTLLLGGRRPPAPVAYESPAVHTMLIAVRLMAAHFLLGQAFQTGSWFALDEAREAVYAATKFAPLFVGPGEEFLHFAWFNHCMNFFRCYMTTPGAGLLYAVMRGLPASQRPTAWEGPLKPGVSPIGTHWKGTLAHQTYDKLTRFRNNPNSDREADQIHTDHYVEDGTLQDLYLGFLSKEEQDTMTWPAKFENSLHSRRYRDAAAKKMAARQGKRFTSDVPPDDSIRFEGRGRDIHEDFAASGWLNPLPDQCGIPGWQRITFMKHDEKDINYIVGNDLWACEGVVLPGGKIMMGRWWYVDNNILSGEEYSGPFIFWAVEPPAGY